ncbi:hypothetical protein [Bacillus cereus]|uniref:hypothetical protein n=1 Tax=Bacillus cereus TaxID=1396 RepID=UPI003F8A3ED2
MLYNKIYEYKEFPDRISGRCDNCGNSLFKSSVKDFVFLRKCSQKYAIEYFIRYYPIRN